MTAKFVLLAVFLCSCPVWVTATEDYTGIRASTLTQLEAHRKIVEEYTFKITFQSENDKINIVTNNRLQYGNVLSERAHFEMGQLGDSYRFIADLMNASKSVIQCMDQKTQEAQHENEKQLMDKFYRPVREKQHKADKAELDRMFEWNEVKSNLHKKYTKIYNEATMKIKASESPKEIKATLNVAKEAGEELIKAAKEAIAAVRKLQLDQLKYAEDNLEVFRKYIRGSLDNMTESLQNCFLVKSPYYNIKSILNKVM